LGLIIRISDGDVAESVDDVKKMKDMVRVEEVYGGCSDIFARLRRCLSEGVVIDEVGE
jgi:hypothetical protein